MRVRRVLGHSTLLRAIGPRSKATTASVGSTEKANLLRSLTSLRVANSIPLDTHSLHPNSYKNGLGLAEYSSGKWAAPENLRRVLNVDEVAFSFCPERPMSGREKRALQRSIFIIDHLPRSCTIGECLEEVRRVAVRPFQILKGTQDVHFKLFMTSDQVKPMKLLQNIITSKERKWNLSLHQHGGPQCESSSGGTLVLLHASHLSILNWCKYNDRSGVPPLLTVHFKLVGHMLPSSMKHEQGRIREASDRDFGNGDGPVQTLVDEINRRMVQSVYQKTFKNPHEILSTINGEVLAYLRSSPPATAIDLNRFEVACVDKNLDRRYSLNTLLNADDTEGPRAVEHKSGSPDLEKDIHQEEEIEHELKVSTTPQRFSDATATKFGFELDRLDLKSTIQGAHELPGPSATTIINEIDSLSRSVDEVGLALCSIVLSRLAQKFPKLSVRIQSPNIFINLTRAGSSTATSIRRRITVVAKTPLGYSWDSNISVMVHNITGNVARLSEDPSKPIEIESLSISLRGKHDRHAQESGHQLSLRAEIEALAQMTMTVVDKLCEELVFDSCEAISTQLAEACLRTVRFLSHNIDLNSAQVTAKLPDPSGRRAMVIQSNASRKHATTDLPTGAVADVLQSSVVQNSRDFSPDVRQVQIDGNEQDTTSPATSRVVDGEELVDSGEDIQRHGQPYAAPRHADSPQRIHGGIQLSHAPDIESSPFAEKTGMSRFGFRLWWSEEHGDAVAHLTSQKVQALIENAIITSAASGLQYVQEVVDKLAEVTPPMKVTLTLRQSYGQLSKSDDDLIDRSARLEVHSTWHSVSGKTRKTEISFYLPDMRGLPIQIEGLTLEEVALARWQVIMRGSLSGKEAASSTRNIPGASQQILRSIRDIISLSVRGRRFASLQSAAKTVVEVIGREAKAFEEIFVLGDVRVISCVRRESDATLLQAAERRHINLLAQDAVRGIFVALGSNQGDRLERIESACRAIDEDPDISVISTSALYETEPMYVEDQGRFLNGACEIKTKLHPLELLDRLQAIEQKMGRVKVIDKGPRSIDLDILLYRYEWWVSDRLTIPHPLMLEREFVLRPLCDMPMARTRIHRGIYPPRQYMDYLGDLSPQAQPMHSLASLAATQEDVRPTDPTRSTRIMSILNVTPDSFSDGGVNAPADIGSLKTTIAAQIAAGASIIDIGGQSSRPNAVDVSADEELARVLPAIEAIKSLPEADQIAISVDTYRAAVAEAAVKAGAHIINDISAGTLDDEMLPTIARLGCTYIMMHMRGTPATMQSEENCSYPEGLIPTIALELWQRVLAAQNAGIRRWRIVLDPGIGFAKIQEQNVELLTKLSELRQNKDLRTFPWLVGSSRKSFIGKITGVEEPKERTWGTAATVTAAVQGGADIVRVHDVREMADVVRMADAMYRV